MSSKQYRSIVATTILIFYTLSSIYLLYLFAVGLANIANSASSPNATSNMITAIFTLFALCLFLYGANKSFAALRENINESMPLVGTFAVYSGTTMILNALGVTSSGRWGSEIFSYQSSPGPLIFAVASYFLFRRIFVTTYSSKPAEQGAAANP